MKHFNHWVAVSCEKKREGDRVKGSRKKTRPAGPCCIIGGRVKSSGCRTGNLLRELWTVWCGNRWAQWWQCPGEGCMRSPPWGTPSSFARDPEHLEREPLKTPLSLLIHCLHLKIVISNRCKVLTAKPQNHGHHGYGGPAITFTFCLQIKPIYNIWYVNLKSTSLPWHLAAFLQRIDKTSFKFIQLWKSGGGLTNRPISAAKWKNKKKNHCFSTILALFLRKKQWQFNVLHLFFKSSAGRPQVLEEEEEVTGFVTRTMMTIQTHFVEVLLLQLNSTDAVAGVDEFSLQRQLLLCANLKN